MARRLLVLGVGGPFREGFFRVAARRGIETILVDDNPYNRYDRLADAVVLRSPADPDLLRDLPSAVGPVDGVTSLSDLAASMVEHLARRYGVPAPGARGALAAHDKTVLRRLTGDLTPVPWSLVEHPDDLAPLCREVGGPVVLKPVDGAGSFGVTVARDEAEARAQLGYVIARSRRGAAIAEAYLAGQEYSFEVTVAGGAVRWFSVTEKTTSGVPAFLERQHVVERDQRRYAGLGVPAFLARLVAALGVEHAVLHVEARHGSPGWGLIEVALRPAGGMIVEVTRAATGVDLYEHQISVALGEEVPAMPAPPAPPAATGRDGDDGGGAPDGRPDQVAGVRFAIGTGVLQDVRSVARLCAGLTCVVHLSPLLPAGTGIHRLDANWCRAGYVLARGGPRGTVLGDLKLAEQRLTAALGLHDPFPDQDDPHAVARACVTAAPPG
ncbi:MAG TPA: ATP-grasp domain-containing protein [Micromonosporaceae bacterium]|nr:ATP-grasp domain-containing protein [Micromonosporaceae bacterium]